jgi:hypothetical protein
MMHHYHEKIGHLSAYRTKFEFGILHSTHTQSKKNSILHRMKNQISRTMCASRGSQRTHCFTAFCAELVPFVFVNWFREKADGHYQDSIDRKGGTNTRR